jgi:hypothetical protein
VSNPVVPDTVELEGVNYDGAPFIPVVPVKIEGPARVQQLPSQLGDARTLKLKPARVITAPSGGDATARQNGDSRRKRMVLLSTDQPFYYGLNQETVEGGTAALWPINVALVIEHCAEFWLASANAAGTTLTIIREDWAP